ncbi:MAG: CIA30 family protein [Kangiellaceae bacterium]|nr:CIA30 family protein [Kangiellaceae bacterium]
MVLANYSITWPCFEPFLIDETGLISPVRDETEMMYQKLFRKLLWSMLAGLIIVGWLNSHQLTANETVSFAPASATYDDSVSMNVSEKSKRPTVKKSRTINWLSQEDAEWYIVNDGVMGGRSRSDLYISKEGIHIFTGILSLENNGGFASVRTRVNESLFGSASAVCIRVKGDGRTYQLRLRDRSSFDGPAYVKEFVAHKDRWTEYAFKFDQFEPQFRGRSLKGYRDIKQSIEGHDIRQVGILLGDKNPGEFNLLISELSGCVFSQSNNYI